MVMQPMGLGVDSSRFEERREMEEKKAYLLEQQAVQKAAQLQEELRSSPLLAILVRETEALMLKIYLEHPDGQAQDRLWQQLKVGVDPAYVIKNLVRRRMGPILSDLVETYLSDLVET